MDLLIEAIHREQQRWVGCFPYAALLLMPPPPSLPLRLLLVAGCGHTCGGSAAAATPSFPTPFRVSKTQHALPALCSPSWPSQPVPTPFSLRPCCRFAPSQRPRILEHMQFVRDQRRIRKLVRGLPFFPSWPCLC